MQRGFVLTAVAVALLVVAIGIGERPDAGSVEAAPAPTTPTAQPPASPSPSPSPTTPPVAGEATVEVVDASRTELLHVAEPVATDDAAVDAFVADVTRWLDDHLTALQRGEPGSLDDSMLLDGASPELVAAVTTDLAGPDSVVAAASYTIEVAVAGEPLWATAVVEVAHVDGASAAAELVFAPGEAGPDVLAAGPMSHGEAAA